MAELLAPMVARDPDGTALRAGDHIRTWSEVDSRVNRWVHVLRSYGLEPGDRVAFVLGNEITTYEALLACLHAGLVAVPVSWRLVADEIAYLLDDSGSRVVLTPDRYAAKVAQAVTRVDRRPAVCVPREEVDGADGEPSDQVSGSVMLYTSATTGVPKGVGTGLLRAGAPLDRVRRTLAALGEAFGLPDDGRVLLAGPWYHAAQAFFSLFPLLRGSSLVLHRRFDAAAVLADLNRERITLTHLVPTQFVRLLGLDEATRRAGAPAALTRVWHGGAACPPDVKRRMLDWWGPVLTEYYAATEAGIVTTIDAAEWLARPGSVGRPVPGTTVLILADDGTEAPVGQTGTVYIGRSSGFHYHNAEAKTAKAHRAAGVFTVGDLGHVDADGYLYLTGRSLDTIISGGVNIYPAEVEAALLGHPAVRDVAVLGIPDDEFGERVLAVVEPATPDLLGSADLADRLDAHCRGRLADFKRPRRYVLVPELPREPTGKLNRRALRDPYWSS